MTNFALNSNQIEFSPYLQELHHRFGDPRSIEDIHNSVASADALALLSLKAEFSLAWVKTKFASFDEMGRVWSHFADTTIDRALELAWRQAAKRHRLKIPDGPVAGLFLLGLGKLGGYDLNFSSDVDLIAFYDPETLPVPEHLGQAYIASDVCKRVTQILHPRNAPDFVWRVDWRLRPESSGTGLAMSSSKAENFYFFRSLPWHRLAMMKARVVGGDQMAGRRFLARLEPFIWRRNLDFTTLEDLAQLKSRINNEHPGLQYERAAPQPITPMAQGFNVKLGRGGIREIEFIANAQQLIHGGKRPHLRVTNTRNALLNLAEKGLLPQGEAEMLGDDYVVFRKLENAIQMLRNEQIHSVPTGADFEALLGLLCLNSEFHQDIYLRRQRVHQRFSELFEGSISPAKPVSVSSLSNTAASIAQSWMNGFDDHSLPASRQTQYRDLGRRLTKRVMKHSDPDAFDRVNAFLRQLGRSEQYFSLLDRHTELLDKLITPLLHSPHMTEILRQSPHIIDTFIAQESDSLNEQSQFVLTSTDYERRLEALRRFVNEQLFKAYSYFLDGQFTQTDLQTRLTTLAEKTLDLALSIVTNDLGLKDLPMAVLGLGKLGTRSMSPKSDLDLVFLFDDDVDPDLSVKIVQRLRTTLTVKLREGIAYELDMRLRPSGRSGPPAVKLTSFYDHHMKRAHSWEHIALTPARIVAGNREIGEQAETIKAKILSRPRDVTAFKKDALAMFDRLKTERLQDTQPDIWRSKLRRGGLMEVDYIQSCLKISNEAISKDIKDASDAWNRLLTWERLLSLTGQRTETTPNRFAKAIGVANLSSEQEKLEETICLATKSYFEGVDFDPTETSMPIVWKT